MAIVLLHGYMIKKSGTWLTVWSRGAATSLPSSLWPFGCPAEQHIHWQQGWGWSRDLRLLAVSENWHHPRPGLFMVFGEEHAEFTEGSFHFSIPFLRGQVLQSMYFIQFSGNDSLLPVFETDLINQSHSFLNRFTFIPEGILIRQH